MTQYFYFYAWSVFIRKYKKNDFWEKYINFFQGGIFLFVCFNCSMLSKALWPSDQHCELVCQSMYRFDMFKSWEQNFANSFSAKPVILVSSKYQHKNSKGKTRHPKCTNNLVHSSYCEADIQVKDTQGFSLQYWLFQKPHNRGLHIGIQNLLS